MENLLIHGKSYGSSAAHVWRLRSAALREYSKPAVLLSSGSLLRLRANALFLGGGANALYLCLSGKHVSPVKLDCIKDILLKQLQDLTSSC